MGDGGDSKRDLRASKMDNLSLEIATNRFSRDLLQRFMGNSSENEVAKEEDEEIELNLGLSLGGRFGVDKSSNKLVRSSSIAECLPVVRDDNDAVGSPQVTYNSLARASSLPVETEEEWRKRKELQTLRRMEAKRRRSEKQRILKSEKEGGGSGGSGSGGNGGDVNLDEKREIELNLRAKLDRDKCVAATKRWAGPPVRLSSWTAAAAKQALLGGGFDITAAKGKGSGEIKGSSQGSIESQGGCSSCMSELESKPRRGGEEPCQEGSNRDVGSSGTKAKENPTESPSKRSTNLMEDMPCVFTKGDGPNGRRVDGILYKYGKGEDVRIMCVCHGSFLSPAEFVKHAGGSDVDHPLKHIVVNPNAPSLL